MQSKSCKRERAFFILHRWVNIAWYAVIGSAFIAYGGSIIADWGERNLARLAGVNSRFHLLGSRRSGSSLVAVPPFGRDAITTSSLDTPLPTAADCGGSFISCPATLANY